MQLLSLFVVFTLAVGVYSNCGCLECNKNLHVISRPGDRVKIIYKNPCECPSSVPYSIQIPVVAPEIQTGGGCYGYQIQPGKVIRPNYNPCPVARSYDPRVLFPVQGKQIAPLQGLSSSLDRVLLAGPSQSLSLNCPQPRIEYIRPQRTQNYYGYPQYLRYGHTVPKTPLPGRCSDCNNCNNCCNCKIIPSNFCKSCKELGQICNCQNCNNCCNCKTNPSANVCKSCNEMGQICNCQNCNNCCNCKTNPSADFCKSCMERGQICNCQNFEKRGASTSQRIVSSKPTFVRIYRKMSAVPKPDMCTCQDSGPRILKIKPYHQVLLNPKNVKIVHRYEISSFEDIGGKKANVFQASSYETIPELQSRILDSWLGNAGRTPRDTFEDTIRGFRNPSVSPICLNCQHMPKNGKYIRTMQKTNLENNFGSVPSFPQAKPIALQPNFEETKALGYGMKIEQGFKTFPVQETLARIENPEKIKSTLLVEDYKLQAKNNNPTTDNNFHNRNSASNSQLPNVSQAKPRSALQPRFAETKEPASMLQYQMKKQGLGAFSAQQELARFKDVNSQKPKNSQLPEFFSSSLLKSTLELQNGPEIIKDDSRSQPKEVPLTHRPTSLNRTEPNASVYSNSNQPRSFNFIQSESSFTILRKDASPQAFFHNTISSFSSNPAPFSAVDSTDSDRSKRSINYQLLASKTNPSPKPRRPSLGYFLHKNTPAIMASSVPKAHPKKFQAGNWANPLHKPALIKKTPNLPKLPPKRHGNVMLQSALKKTSDFLDELFSVHNPLNPREVQMPNYEEEEYAPPQRWWHEDEELKPTAWSKFNRLGRLRRAIRVEDESMLPFYDGGDTRRRPSVVSRCSPHGRSPDSYREPSNFGPASIIQLMNAPIRYLSQLHRLGSPGAPIGAIPKVINVSKRYALEMLKGLSKSAIRIGANVITDVGRLRKPKLLPKRRHRRSVPANLQNYEKLIHLLQSLIRPKRNEQSIDESSQKEESNISATQKSERRKRAVEDDDSDDQFGEGPGTPLGDEDSFDEHDDAYSHMHDNEFNPFRRDKFDKAEGKSNFHKKRGQKPDSSINKEHEQQSFLSETHGSEASTSQKQYEELEKTILELEELLKDLKETPRGEELASPDQPDEHEDFEDFFHSETPEDLEDSGQNTPKPADFEDDYTFLKQFSNSGDEPTRFLPKSDSSYNEFTKQTDEDQPEKNSSHDDHFIAPRRKREVARIGVNKAISIGEKVPGYEKFVANTNHKIKPDDNDVKRGSGKTSNLKNNAIIHNTPTVSSKSMHKIMEVTEKPFNPSELDIEIQAIEAKVGQLAVNIQRLKDLTFADDCSLHDNLLKLEIVKTNITELLRSTINNNQDSPQTKRQLLDKLKEAQDLKEEALRQTSSQLSGNKSVSKKKLIRILVRLQKFHCIVKKFRQRLTEGTLDGNKEIANVDLLEKLHFTPGTDPENCLTSWKTDKDEELAEEIWLQEKLEKVLKSGNRNIILEEAEILWEIKNVEKLQQVYIFELNQKISQGSQRIRSELKILFDLQNQMDQCEEKQNALIRSLGRGKD